MADIKATMSNAWQSTQTMASSAITSIKKLDVQHGKRITITQKRQTILAVAVSSVALFCMWGLAYGLLDIMNYHVRIAMDLRRQDAALLAAAYYGAYIPGSLLVGGPVVKNLGYRLAMVTGLFILGLGDLVMSLGAAKCSFAGMVLGHLVIGIGVSTLERSANPYVVNCGPRTQATLRILIAQAWAGLGTVIAPFLANAFVFNPDSSGVRPESDLLHPGKCLAPPTKEGSCANLGTVITFYRVLAASIIGIGIALTILFFRTHLVPEVEVSIAPPTTCGWKKWKHPLVSWKYARVWWGVVANFMNIGCQVTFAQFFIEHMKINACASDKWAAWYMSIAQGLFVVGRFAAAGLVSVPKVFKPRYVLCGFIAGAVAMTAAGTATTGSAVIVVACMVMFFEAPSFPMIFESATAGLGQWTSTCETLMILSICGGGLQPALMGQLVEAIQISKGWWLTAGCFALVFTYTVAINVFPSFKQALDRVEVEGADDTEMVAANKRPSDTPSTVPNTLFEQPQRTHFTGEPEGQYHNVAL